MGVGSQSLEGAAIVGYARPSPGSPRQHGVASRFNVRSARNSFRRPQFIPEQSETYTVSSHELRHSDQITKSEHGGDRSTAEKTERLGGSVSRSAVISLLRAGRERGREARDLAKRAEAGNHAGAGATVATVLHQPLIETDDVKWRLAGQSATTVLNCAAQADIVRAFALCRVVR